jgi:16S rRNA (cytosine967-C5)-methyltransferase
LAERQRAILVNCWRLLRPGGRLLYVTCSLLPEENARVVGEFLSATPEARELRLEAEMATVPAIRLTPGWQLLPGGSAGGDGFYYACLDKDPQ